MRVSSSDPVARARRLRLAVASTASALAVAALPSSALAASDTTQFSVIGGALAFGTAPDVPSIPAVTLNGQAQTRNAQMNDFSVDDSSGTAAGWNVTVAGDDGAGKSPVFKQYDTTSSTYGSVALAQNSLTLTSTGASFSPVGGSGTAPSHQCGSGCFVDGSPSSPVKVASAAASAGMGIWETSSWSSSSLALAVPSTTQALGVDEVYRLDLAWSLNSGP
jgi:hypothetical protein